MDASKEFLGKTLDAAIAEACAYYGVQREKLEVDIIEDAKTGIFGIVGARKAKIRAHVVKLPAFLKNMDPAQGAGDGGSPAQEEPKPRQRGKKAEKAPKKQADAPSAATLQKEEDPCVEQAVQEAGAPAAAVMPQPGPEAKESAGGQPGPEAGEAADGIRQPEAEAGLAAVEEEAAGEQMQEAERPRKEARRGRRSPRPAEGESVPAPARDDDPEAPESALPSLPLKELDQEKLAGEVRTVLGMLAAPVLGIEKEELDLSMEVNEERVLVSLRGDDTGLLIGRDGQNLAAIQYLASRIVSRNMNAQVRLNVDAGDYHMRQDSRLHELALTLAERVKQTGKPQTTRPLSAYQRRVIHLALQDDPDVLTRSSGEGVLKHVVILRRKD